MTRDRPVLSCFERRAGRRPADGHTEGLQSVGSVFRFLEGLLSGCLCLDWTGPWANDCLLWWWNSLNFWAEPRGLTFGQMQSERPEELESERPEELESERREELESERPEELKGERPKELESERPEKLESESLRPEELESERPEELEREELGIKREAGGTGERPEDLESERPEELESERPEELES
uniref:Uncharacterized protein n=1 Tax=Chromera velia CCMP2878 TaxID=1169474 RepID=A0A0G4H0I0_9ALVE|eukprot:Cvel_24150.t1-p1 / transcript=Cvel_24150.t1 / gene=Cvel_24150 / organism=Chromera_velia_CCMP2878 / gene_product=hypothetical protein / transcript_product=hypothetical protein / location=Cvel_scaffold2577:15312-19355(-) / protein_length=184 / sequence_SO=supercontig / SO=protein_coding / is_pseudo=false